MKNFKSEMLFYTRNGFVTINKEDKKDTTFEKVDIPYISTLLCNIAYYGFTLSKEVISELSTCSKEEIVNFWKNLELSLKDITGDKYNVSDFVLYKNFPKEVLDMSTAEYWYRQFLVYLGADYDLVAQKEEKRRELDLNELQPKVLHLSNEDTKYVIKNMLVSMPNRWNENQFLDIVFLKDKFEKIVLEDFGFKENGIRLMVYLGLDFKNNIKNNKLGSKLKKLDLLSSESHPIKNFVVNEATDVLRLGAGLSGSDYSLKNNVHFNGLSRVERKTFLSMLENSKNLENDVILRKKLFKRFFRSLHPGDYKFNNVKKVYNKLYKDNLSASFHSQYEKMLEEKNELIFDLIKSRPGFFMREYHALYARFGKKATLEFLSVLDKLETIQLLKFKAYINTINDREFLVYTPKSNWSKALFVKNNKIKVEDIKGINKSINKVLKKRVLKKEKEGFNVEEKLKNVKLQTNDQKLASYGRGTVFDIPDNIRFIRSASYWNLNSGAFVDNTWNFFGENWEIISTCCWDHHKDNAKSIHKILSEGVEEEDLNNFKSKAGPVGAVFSGDSINQKEGKASQLIDLYIEVLERKGVRYAVWSMLSYNGISLNEFNEVFAGLILGEDPESGKLFEPSRVKFAFDISKENTLSKIIAYVDIKKRQIVYLDINKGLNIRSGKRNENDLKECMPPILEYVESLPSVYDLLSVAKGKKHAVYTDKELNLDENEKAYAFMKENENIKSEQFISVEDFI